MYSVAIVGAGSIGKKRADVAMAHPNCNVEYICDIDHEKAEILSSEFGATSVSSWQNIVESGVDIVVVSTTHEHLAAISSACLKAGKHVLCEKPMGRCPTEVYSSVKAAEETGSAFWGGYNHRYHPSLQELKRICDSGELGALLSIRARYGHGGRPGYDREWRAIPELAGGGELLDQGIHLVDLSLWLLGDFSEVSGYVETHYWDMKPLEDNAYGLFRTANGQIASIHASWTQWKNLFCFEVFGREGYAVVEGLGRSYGREKLRVGKRRIDGGVPEEKTYSFSGCDISWELEWNAFLDRIVRKKSQESQGLDGLTAIEWVYRLYRASAERRAIDHTEVVK
ncbi:MAG: Gfo/Idh/MocA family oxidoreductase [Candidatus Latescibacterota bacterium]|nr:Gfo/Idh/MocA family oxidoreductase [Candidatus Latescibacterota bacterium]